MNNREKFLALVSKEETKTVERAKERVARRNYTRLSQKIALSILARLDELGWKQVTLAQKMGVSAQQVNKWVKGGENFTIETLANLSDVLGIELISVGRQTIEPRHQSVAFEMTEEYTFSNQINSIALGYSLHAETNYENNFLKAN